MESLSYPAAMLDDAKTNEFGRLCQLPSDETLSALFHVP